MAFYLASGDCMGIAAIDGVIGTSSETAYSHEYYIFNKTNIYREFGRVESTFSNASDFSTTKSKGYIKFASSNTTPVVWFYGYESQTSKLQIPAADAPLANRNIYVLDLAKLYDVDPATITDAYVESNCPRWLPKQLTRVLSSKTPEQLIEDGTIIKTSLTYQEVEGGGFDSTRYWSKTVDVNDPDGFEVSTVALCDTVFGTTLNDGREAYAVLFNNLATYYNATDGEPPEPPEPPTPHNITIDVSGVPEGINVSSQLDLGETYTDAQISGMTDESTMIQFRLAKGYTYTQQTQYSDNGVDWYPCYLLDGYPDEQTMGGDDSEFSIKRDLVDFNSGLKSDVTIKFKGGVKSDKPTPPPVSLYNSAYKIDAQKLHNLRNFNIGFISHGDVQSLDLSGYVVACYQMRGAVPTEGSQTIYLGKNNTNTQGEIITQEVLAFDCGSIDLTGIEADESTVQVWLPFSGFKSVENAVGHVLSIDYAMHVGTGNGVYSIYLDDTLVGSQDADNAYNLPLRITSATVQSQSSNPMTLAELKTFALAEVAGDWVKGVSYDKVRVENVPCTARERELLESVIKDGVI
jgi:hypothetical protein